MKLISTYISKTVIVFCFLAFFLSSFPSFAVAQGGDTPRYQAIVTGVEKIESENGSGQRLELEILNGDKKGTEILVENLDFSAKGVETVQYIEHKEGDKINIEAFSGMDGKTEYALRGYVKRDGITLLLLIFVVVVVLVGKMWGVLSLVGLSVSFLVIFRMIIPMIIDGNNPVVSAILGAVIIVPTTFYISHGFNKKTHVGVGATLFMLTVTGILSLIFIDLTYLTGYASEEAGFLQVERLGTIDIRGLLLAGIIIGTLGVLDDVTVGQASIVEQLRKANKKMSVKELYNIGMKVGQDHISSMVNTLVLVYSGSALPLLLLFFGSEQSFLDIIEFELIAEEIVRMLVGSIGLVLAAPLATILAAYSFSKD